MIEIIPESHQQQQQPPLRQTTLAINFRRRTRFESSGRRASLDPSSMSRIPSEVNIRRGASSDDSRASRHSSTILRGVSPKRTIASFQDPEIRHLYLPGTVQAHYRVANIQVRRERERQGQPPGNQIPGNRASHSTSTSSSRQGFICFWFCCFCKRRSPEVFMKLYLAFHVSFEIISLLLSILLMMGSRSFLGFTITSSTQEPVYLNIDGEPLASSQKNQAARSGTHSSGMAVNREKYNEFLDGVAPIFILYLFLHLSSFLMSLIDKEKFSDEDIEERETGCYTATAVLGIISSLLSSIVFIYGAFALLMVALGTELNSEFYVGLEEKDGDSGAGSGPETSSFGGGQAVSQAQLFYLSISFLCFMKVLYCFSMAWNCFQALFVYRRALAAMTPSS